MPRLTTLLLPAVFTLMVSACDSVNSKKQTSFYVRGNCGMCEERIEIAAKEVDGVLFADWNVKTKQLDITYDTLKVDVPKLQQTVANVGHETNNYKSPEEVHEDLPLCCQKGSKM